MKRAFEDYSRRGIITSDAYHYAVAHGYAPETLERLREGVEARVRTSRVSLALQSAPLLYKPAPELSNPNDPTPEWKAKAGKRIASTVVERGEYMPIRVHRLRGVIEQYGRMLSEVQRAALERFVYDSAMILRIKVSDLNASGGGTPNKLGGIGNAPDYRRRALARHAWVIEFLSTEARTTAKLLVTHELSRNDGAPLTMEEFGQRIMSIHVKHAREQWGFALGALWVLAGQLVHLYGICPHDAQPVSLGEREAMIEGAST
jgi:hypothetical protein